MLHQDGSRHVWLAGQAAMDLIVTLDDATSAIYSALLVPEEGTDSTFRALREVFEAHGLPCSLYTERGRRYFLTPEADGKVAKDQLTQVSRALEHLGIEHIAADTPQARGRSERAFRTLQDRLPKELAFTGVKALEDANGSSGKSISRPITPVSPSSLSRKARSARNRPRLRSAPSWTRIAPPKLKRGRRCRTPSW